MLNSISSTENKSPIERGVNKACTNTENYEVGSLRSSALKVSSQKPLNSLKIAFRRS